MSTPGDTAPAQPPVLVLGCRRSGTSAVTGLLAEAGGLRLGAVLAASEANPRGYFESASVVKTHNDVLEALDRDWTCPPAHLDLHRVVTDGLAAGIEQLSAGGGPWGVKDPRLLFMLPIWARLLDRLRLVGVIRDHEEVVRSIVDRDGIDAGVADQLARAYVRRLRHLRDEFEFPVIDFSSGPEEVVARTAAVAKTLGLDWDARVAEDFLDPELVGSRARGLLDNPDLDHLRALPEVAVTSLDTDRLAGFLARLDDVDPALDRHVGPRANARRARLWAAVPFALRPATEFVRTTRVASSVTPEPDGARVVVCHRLETMHAALADAERSRAIVLTDVLSWLEVDELEPAMALLHEHLRGEGLLVVGISRADRETREVTGREPLGVERLTRTAREAGFMVLSREADDLLTIVRMVASASRLQPDPELEEVRAAAARARSSARQWRVKAEEWQQRTWELQARLERLQLRHDRLRERRSVRAVVRVAALARPVFALARRVRKRSS